MKFGWDPALYDNKHDFVFKFGEEIVDILNPSPKDIILDLGCGTGDLTKRISDSCKKVFGIDNSSKMIETAKNKYPEIDFHYMDAKNFKFDFCFDAIFSNSALHWATEPEIVVRNINKHLKIGGRFVAEFGGKGCVNKIISALTEVLDRESVDYPKIEDFLYYPSISEYSTLLEKNGFEVVFASLFDRPTKLKGGNNGLKNFIEMFFNWMFSNVSLEKKMKYIALVEEKLKKQLLQNSGWLADYRRIRLIAIKHKQS